MYGVHLNMIYDSHLYEEQHVLKRILWNKCSKKMELLKLYTLHKIVR
jgi:hypothetical protein